MSSSYPPQGEQIPWSREVVEPLVAPHLDRFADVLSQAWEGFSEARDSRRGRIGEVGAGSRGMVVSDLTRGPAARVFDGVAGARVVERFDRPWVHLAEGLVQVRFRKLTSTLAIAPGQSERSRRLAYHLPDLTLDEGAWEATVLTAGYVLGPGGVGIEQMALVCHLGFHQVHYWFPLPGGEVANRPAQMPLAPLSEPIIRSARAAALKRLADRPGS